VGASQAWDKPCRENPHRLVAKGGPSLQFRFRVRKSYFRAPAAMRPFVLPMLLLAALLLGGCGEFNKALKSNDLEYKTSIAEKYYEAGKYERAIPLLEELIVLCRGGACSERMNYLHAKSHFNMKDYIMGAYYLANFTRTFPRSSYAEECAFLSAYCHYKNSPAFPLDQSETRSAIEQMQLFMVRYPGTSLRDSCNTLIDRMRLKLEEKSYRAAEQYYRMRHYQAASITYRNFMREWPNSRWRETAMMQILRADYNLAINSVEAKRGERLAEGIRSFNNFADAFPESPLLAEANKLHSDMQNALKGLHDRP
jgi:outer membrane protein assembly factor BamD